MNGRAAGVFFLRSHRGRPELDPADVDYANTIAQAAARVLENEERRSAVFRRQVAAGTVDALTGCGSLDALDRRLRDEFERGRRYTLTFSVVLLDIDGLRTVLLSLTKRWGMKCSSTWAPCSNARSARRTSSRGTAATSSRSFFRGPTSPARAGT